MKKINQITILLIAMIVCVFSDFSVLAAGEPEEYFFGQEEKTEAESEEISGQTFEETGEQVPEQISEETGEQVPEQISEETSEQLSEQISEETPEQTSEEISDQMPESETDVSLKPITDEQTDEQTRNEGLQVDAASTAELYAQGMESKYTVVFNGKGKTAGTMQKMTGLEYGQKYTLPINAFTKKGCRFLGWTTEKDGTGAEYADGAEFENLSAINGSTVTLYAKWFEEPYAISYQLDGGENDTFNPESYTVSSKIKLRKPSKYGYTFKGWYTADDYKKKVSGIAKGSTGDRVFYAKWSLTGYQITYKLNGGKNAAGNPVKYYYSTPEIILEAPTKKGFDFEGWYTDAGYTDKIEKINEGSTGNIVLYAKWSPIRYTVNFDAGGAIGILPGAMECDYGKKYKLPWPDLVRNGYVFKGWYPDAGGSGSGYAPGKKMKNLTAKNGDIVTLYALWTRMSSTEESYAQKVVELVNQNRRKQGLPVLIVDPTLSAVAQERAYELAKSFNHKRPNGEICFELFKAAGYHQRPGGENIAYGYANPAEVMEGWMNSTGHKENILNASFTEIGVGCYIYNRNIYWVQCFGKP